MLPRHRLNAEHRHTTFSDISLSEMASSWTSVSFLLGLHCTILLRVLDFLYDCMIVWTEFLFTGNKSSVATYRFGSIWTCIILLGICAVEDIVFMRVYIESSCYTPVLS
ncbi:hypothetical protein NEOLEDRAFT_898679 [Neolentinus lepideus HHB14362 ss-1]|uniref:Uncharacterized protein n=1 Tax=Neolentinus lepideus HHB14362 ss-1 TaxID=1314782 RepID=A0A165NRF5_9AGAM|nr:hypothetical protein NEOLEDRAFT_898679 [Neolentinus lepideus HHB14362 ss-1]